MLRLLFPTALLLTVALLPADPTGAQDAGLPAPTMSTVTEGIALLTGAGGNIAVCHGADGVLLVDDQFAAVSASILASVEELGAGPPRFVVNTHWHWDHTEGNANMAAAGALVVAHENVRTRMSTGQSMPAFNRTIPPSPEAALPVITFDDGLSFHWNGGRIDVHHVAPAHTDGDALVHFVDADVLHTGDTFLNGGFPFIDLSSGGRLDGLIAAAERILELTDADTKIIPGHGPLAARTDVQAWHAMLKDARDRIASRLEGGFTVEEVVRFNPLEDLHERWGQGFISTEMFTGTAASSLLRDGVGARDAEAGDADR